MKSFIFGQIKYYGFAFLLFYRLYNLNFDFIFADSFFGWRRCCFRNYTSKWFKLCKSFAFENVQISSDKDYKM